MLKSMLKDSQTKIFRKALRVLRIIDKNTYSKLVDTKFELALTGGHGLRDLTFVYLVLKQNINISESLLSHLDIFLKIVLDKLQEFCQDIDQILSGVPSLTEDEIAKYILYLKISAVSIHHYFEQKISYGQKLISMIDLLYKIPVSFLTEKFLYTYCSAILYFAESKQNRRLFLTPSIELIFIKILLNLSPDYRLKICSKIAELLNSFKIGTIYAAVLPLAVNVNDEASDSEKNIKISNFYLNFVKIRNQILQNSIIDNNQLQSLQAENIIIYLAFFLSGQCNREYSFLASSENLEPSEIFSSAIRSALCPIANGANYHKLFNIISTLENCRLKNIPSNIEKSDNDLFKIANICKIMQSELNLLVKKNEIVLENSLKQGVEIPKKYFEWNIG
ncbi:MAG: hypothetical protein MHPSP_001564, partial [Paramarteilia canceri]